MPVDKDYMDARFDGLEKLIRADKENILSYVSAVSKNAKETQIELITHEKDPDAHGAGAVSRSKGEWIQLGVMLLMAAAFAVDLYMRHHIG